MISITIGGISIKLQLWDTAGREKFRSIINGYYRGADAAFIAFDLSSKTSFNRVNKWIESYYKFSNPDVEKNVILIGNKCDLIDKREVISEEIEKFIKDNILIILKLYPKKGKILMKLFFLLLRN